MGQQRRLKQIRRMNRRAEAIYFAQIYGNDSAVAEPRIEEIDDELPIPVFSGKNFEFWVIKMKTLFRAKGVLSVVESGFKEPPNQAAYEVFPQSQKIKLMENMRNDDVALFLIRQGLNERIFPTIVNAASAKEACEHLRREFDARGSNATQQQAKVLEESIENSAAVAEVSQSISEFHYVNILVDKYTKSEVGNEQQLVQDLPEESEVTECANNATCESTVEIELENVLESTNVDIVVMDNARNCDKVNEILAEAENNVEDAKTRDVKEDKSNDEFVEKAKARCLSRVVGDPFRKGVEQGPQIDQEQFNKILHYIKAARKAFDEGPWPKMTVYERSCIVLRFTDLLEKHNDEIAAFETWDNGKPYEQASLVEVPMAVRLFRYYAGWADKIRGLAVPADGPYHVQTLHEPIGVAGQIVPWNFPLLMFAWKVGPALACGNSVVLKSAEQTPLTALYAAKLFHEAGLPPGVLNIVSGFGPTAGAAVARHMDVDEAVELAHFASFFNQGQCCYAGSRIFVHESIHEENSLMKDESSLVDAETQDKAENKMDENVIAENEVEFYEFHENVNLENDNVGAEACAVDEKLAKFLAIKEENEIQKAPIYDEEVLTEAEKIAIEIEMKLILKMFNREETSFRDEWNEDDNVNDSIDALENLAAAEAIENIADYSEVKVPESAEVDGELCAGDVVLEDMIDKMLQICMKLKSVERRLIGEVDNINKNEMNLIAASLIEEIEADMNVSGSTEGANNEGVMDTFEQNDIEEQFENEIFAKWCSEQIKHYCQLISWQQLVQCRIDMLQLKSSEYGQQKVIKNFDDVDGRIRPKDVEYKKFEESKKNVMLKKKVKMKEPKHSWFKVWRRRRWKSCKQV